MRPTVRTDKSRCPGPVPGPARDAGNPIREGSFRQEPECRTLSRDVAGGTGLDVALVDLILEVLLSGAGTGGAGCAELLPDTVN